MAQRVRALASHQVPASTPKYLVWVCCCFSALLREVFPSPQKNSSSTRNQVDEEPLCGCAPPNHYLFIYLNKKNERDVFWINQRRNVHYSNVCNISVLPKPRWMEYVTIFLWIIFPEHEKPIRTRGRRHLPHQVRWYPRPVLSVVK